MLAAKLLVGKNNLVLTAVRNRSFKKLKRRLEAGEQLGGPDDFAYNYIEKKDGLQKPKHTVEEQKDYMKSDVFAEVYKGLSLHQQWKRNIKGQWKLQPPPRLYCIDRYGRFNVSHACPICRDEYLFFDFRNTELMDHFLFAGSDQPLPIEMTGLCREQYLNLKAQIVKAKEHGTMPFNVPFRHFDYAEWYPDLSTDSLTQDDDGERPSRDMAHVEEIYPNAPMKFEAHSRDVYTQWDQWWLRHEKFAKTRK